MRGHTHVSTTPFSVSSSGGNRARPSRHSGRTAPSPHALFICLSLMTFAPTFSCWSPQHGTCSGLVSTCTTALAQQDPNSDFSSQWQPLQAARGLGVPHSQPHHHLRPPPLDPDGLWLLRAWDPHPSDSHFFLKALLAVLFGAGNHPGPRPGCRTFCSQVGLLTVW